MRVVIAQDFDNISHVTYKFDLNNAALITNEVSVVNKQDNLYVSEYSVTLNTDSYSNFVASDKKGAIFPAVSTNKGETTFRLKLNDAVVGKNQINSFVYRYQSNSYIKLMGTNREIRLPIVNMASDYLAYDITVIVPSIYGKISSTSPKPDSVTEQNNLITIRYTQNSGLSNGIYLLFGEFQIYQIDYQVDFQNNKNEAIKTYFPLIPDTDYQQTFQKYLDPKPAEVRPDQDGNWLAYYYVLPGQNLTITGQTLVKVTSKNRLAINLSDKQKKQYLSPTELWPLTDPAVVKIAKKLNQIDQVYRTVLSTLSYDYKGVGPERKRNGALYALNNPDKSVCSEYSDLFVSLARSIGVPAREHQGYAFTNDIRLKSLYDTSDILHSWPDYYDQNTNKWIMVDPTFGDTSGGINYFSNFDNSHITFVIHGTNDQQPVPIGGYKVSPNAHKQITATITQLDDLPPANQIHLITQFAKSSSLINLIKNFITNQPHHGPYFSLFRQPIRITLTNTSGYPIRPPFVSSDGIILLTPESSQTLYPWQEFTVNGIFKPSEYSRNYTYRGYITLGGNNVSLIIPVLSSTALLFYIFIFCGVILFSWLLYRLLFINRLNEKNTKTGNY